MGGLKGCGRAIGGLLVCVILVAIGIGVGVTLTANPDTSEPKPTPTPAQTATPTPMAAEPLPTPTVTTAPPSPTPAVGWTVIADDVRAVTNYRFVEVVLDERIAESELRDLAEIIRAKSPNHPRVHILYWIERMHYEGRAWATTTFERGRALDLDISGLTPDTLAQVLAAPPPDADKIIGRWLTDQLLPAAGGLSTIFLDAEGTPFVEERWPDGSTSTWELVESSAPDGRRFDFLDLRDYLVVKPGPTGRLLFHGESGVFAAGTPVPLAPEPAPEPTTDAATATTTPEPGPVEYVVQPGDTLRLIAVQFGTTIEDLVAANEIDDPNVIRTGAILQIPPSATTSPAPTLTPTRPPAPRPTPSRAAARCPTDAEEEYLGALADELDFLVEGGVALNDLLVVLADSPALAFTEEFDVAFGLSAAVMLVAAENILALDPPSARAQSLHISASTMARKTIEGIEAFAEGVDEFDGDKVAEGGERFIEAADQMQHLTRSIDGFCE